MIFKLRKIKSVFAAAVVLTLAGVVCASAGSMLGDANIDGRVTIKDVTCIQRVLAELPEKQFSEFAADVDGNGTIDITDATLIQKWLAEMETPYPIGSQAEQPTQATQSPTDEEGWGREIFRP